MRTFASKRLVAAALMLLAAGAAGGGDGSPSRKDRMAQARSAWVAAGRPKPESVRPKFGIDDTEVVHVHAYDFKGYKSTDVIRDDSNGYRYFGGESIPFMAAPIHLPAGASIVGIGMSGCTSQAGDLAVALFDNGVGGEGSGGGTLLGNLQMGEGCGWVASNIPPHSHYANQYHPLYAVVWFASNPLDGTVKFNDVFVYFRRQISPAPKLQTFDDVPFTDSAFAHVEALVASGITAGCAPESYCPDDFVTRRQMAVFIAKALGLHWPF